MSGTEQPGGEAARRAPRAARSRYHAGLSRDAVVAAAVALLQAEGAKAFSLRRLATGLGVDTMALYKHVRNRDDLLGAALALALRDVRPAEDGPWWDRVAHAFREHRRVVHDHPWILTLVHDAQVVSAEPWAGADQTLRLLGLHVGPAGAARWMRWLAAFTNGFLLAEPDPAALERLHELDRTYPRVVEAARTGAASGDADFEGGLAVLVSALRREAEERSTPA